MSQNKEPILIEDKIAGPKFSEWPRYFINAIGTGDSMKLYILLNHVRAKIIYINIKSI